MPRPRKPDHLKVVSGTDQPCRMDGPNAVELPLVDDIPPAPEWLINPAAVEEWNRLARILYANKLLTEASLTSLAHMCALHGKIRQLYAAGEAPTASMIGALRAYQNDFGLTPVAQGKVKPSGEVPAANEFAKNGRPGKRQAA
ncbi:hypothetical protein CAL20_02855 [Bordetella genomosp. 4]|uniref:Terminase n=2 Tax=Bordetella genomosp. 4 TaxID=463044 RepID=A0A261URS3_9BORD|nr:hypothetical protein CAL20_02855 [Bordetella genomosp. 4]